MFLSSTEKEDLVIDLLNKNHTLREIAKIAHVSFTDICRIRKKIIGEEIVSDTKSEKKPAKPLSIASQAFQLFKEGNSLVDVAITLDIPKDDVIQNYSDYLILKNMKDVVAIL